MTYKDRYLNTAEKETFLIYSFSRKEIQVQRNKLPGRYITSKMAKSKPVAESDVVISYDPEDIDLVKKLADGIRKTGASVWYEDPKSKQQQTPQRLLACKVFLVLLNEGSAQKPKTRDEVALAYVSNKSIIPVGRQYFRKIAAHLDGGMKLMLAKINWIFFVKDEQFADNLSELLGVLGAYIEKQTNKASEPEEAETLEGDMDGMNINTGRINIVQPGSTQNTDDFWERHFKNEASWIEFREKFLQDYGERIVESFDAEQEKWFVHVMYKDIFELHKTIPVSAYRKFVGQNSHGDPDFFYCRLQDYVTGYRAMREVIDEDSSVRLTMIRNLGAFQTPAVVTTLIDLLEDNDPNIRAVAALALAKTGKKSGKIEDHLIRLLKDEDRLVRESACLSLGHMKCERAVNGIVDLWRNDAIKHVREAAEIALSKMEGEEAERAIHMTKVLSEEMEKLRNAPKT